MKAVKLGKDIYSLPSSWDELTEKDIRQVVRVTSRVKPKYQVQATIALGVLGLNLIHKKPVVYDSESSRLRRAASTDDPSLHLYRIGSGMTKVYLVGADDLALLGSAVEWMFSRPEKGSVCLKSRLTVNPIPEIRIGSRRYVGPTELFDGVRWGQFAEAEVCWSMVSEGDPQAASRAMASLYTLAGGENEEQTRQKYNDFEQVSAEDITLFSLYYEGAKLHLSEHYELFEASEYAEPGMSSFDTTPMSVRVHENFISTTNLLSNLHLNEVEKTRSAYLYDALNILRQNKHNHEQWKRDSTL